MEEKPKLTGLQRFQIIRNWFKQTDFTGTSEDFVKYVCKMKNIEYVPPKPPEKRRR